ncbi:MAG: hypothetical protein HGA45_16540 [Chloroflexales bacterium]|nr:hypothetical protein [Chloroflexales bacterium]
MFKLGSAPLEFRPRGAKALPQAGQKVLVTVRKDVELWQGSRRVRYCEGESYEGTVADVADDDLIDLYIAGGEQMRIHARDVSFEIEALV